MAALRDLVAKEIAIPVDLRQRGITFVVGYRRIFGIDRIDAATKAEMGERAHGLSAGARKIGTRAYYRDAARIE